MKAIHFSINLSNQYSDIKQKACLRSITAKRQVPNDQCHWQPEVRIGTHIQQYFLFFPRWKRVTVTFSSRTLELCWKIWAIHSSMTNHSWKAQSTSLLNVMLQPSVAIRQSRTCTVEHFMLEVLCTGYFSLIHKCTKVLMLVMFCL
jgi:hypothetical protein